VGMANKDDAMATALAQPLGAGPTEWPAPPEAEDPEGGDAEAVETDQTATSGEGS
jgi:hypothetical protein